MLAIALGASLIGMVPSGAAAPSQKCTKLAGSVTLTPGISTVPKTQTGTAKATLSGCAPAAKTGGSGVLTSKLKIPNGSCQGLAKGNQTLKLVSTVKWKNGKTSTITLIAKTGSGSTALTANISGTISKGLFIKHKVTTQIKVATGKGENCTPAHPVKHITFKNSKPFIIS